MESEYVRCECGAEGPVNEEHGMFKGEGERLWNQRAADAEIEALKDRVAELEGALRKLVYNASGFGGGPCLSNVTEAYAVLAELSHES